MSLKTYELTLVIRDEEGTSETFALNADHPAFEDAMRAMSRLSRRILEAHLDEIQMVIARVDDEEV